MNLTMVMFIYVFYEHGHSIKIYVNFITIVIIKPDKAVFVSS